MSIIEEEHLEEFSLKQRRDGKKLVFTNGCFDVLHPGHLSLLEQASRWGDLLIVGINDDASVKRLKGPGRPIYPSRERAEILLSVRWVDYVTIFSEDTPLEVIKRLRPDVLVKGDEYGERDIVGADLVKSYNGEVVRVKMLQGYSSTALIDRIAKRSL